MAAPPIQESWGKDALLLLGGLLAAAVPVGLRRRWFNRSKSEQESSAVQVEKLKNDATFAELLTHVVNERLADRDVELGRLRTELTETREQIMQLRVEIGVHMGMVQREVERNMHLRDEVIKLTTNLQLAELDRGTLREQISVLQSKAGVQQGERRVGAVAEATPQGE